MNFFGSESESKEDAYRRGLNQSMNKRPRNNAILDYIICGSRQSPTLHRTGLLREEPETVKISEFFPSGHDMNLPKLFIDGKGGAPNGLKEIFTTTSEDDMRNSLATYLRDFHNIKFAGFPTKSENQKRPATFTVEKYKESQMKTIFKDLSLTNLKNTLVRFNSGMPITGTSSSDLVVLRNQNSIYQFEPVVGKLKNEANVNHPSESVNQALLHCLAHLYDARVFRGAPVNSVYGFAVNGPNVPGVEYYEVILVRVLATETLSNYHTLQQCITRADNFDDTRPLQTLIHFFQEGERSSIAGDILPQDRLAPCRFLLPSGLWNSDLQVFGQSQARLFLSGTLAIAFKGTKEALLDIINDFSDEGSESLPYLLIKDFVEDIKNTRGYVVKFQYPLIAGNRDWKIARNTLQGDPDFKVTYPIRPLPDGVVFMRCRGKRLIGNEFESLEALRLAFQHVWDGTMHLCRNCKPCDTLPHNMVFGGKFLHLIDVDENFNKSILERALPEHFEEDYWLEALRYPNYFRNEVWLFALIQLAYSVYVICQSIPMQRPNKDILDFMESGMKTLGKSLLVEIANYNRGKKVKTNPAPKVEDKPMPKDRQESLSLIALSLQNLLALGLPDDFPGDQWGIPHVSQPPLKR